MHKSELYIFDSYFFIDRNCKVIKFPYQGRPFERNGNYPAEMDLFLKLSGYSLVLRDGVQHFAGGKKEYAVSEEDAIENNQAILSSKVDYNILDFDGRICRCNLSELDDKEIAEVIKVLKLFNAPCDVTYDDKTARINEFSTPELLKILLADLDGEERAEKNIELQAKIDELIEQFKALVVKPLERVNMLAIINWLAKYSDIANERKNYPLLDDRHKEVANLFEKNGYMEAWMDGLFHEDKDHSQMPLDIFLPCKISLFAGLIKRNIIAPRDRIMGEVAKIKLYDEKLQVTDRAPFETGRCHTIISEAHDYRMMLGEARLESFKKRTAVSIFHPKFTNPIIVRPYSDFLALYKQCRKIELATPEERIRRDEKIKNNTQHDMVVELMGKDDFTKQSLMAWVSAFVYKAFVEHGMDNLDKLDLFDGLTPRMVGERLIELAKDLGVEAYSHKVMLDLVSKGIKIQEGLSLSDAYFQRAISDIGHLYTGEYVPNPSWRYEYTTYANSETDYMEAIRKEKFVARHGIKNQR